MNGKESHLGLGTYPDVSQAHARQQRDGIRNPLTQNIHPTQPRNVEKTTRSTQKTVKDVAVNWHKSHRTWSQNHSNHLPASLNPLFIMSAIILSP
ncbi:Arm DNA-binding domain-containing protein [Erwinia amylovora]